MFQYNCFQEAEVVDVSSTNQTLTRPSYLFVGSTGTVTVDTYGGQTGVLFTGVINGQVLPILVTKVYKTGTSASNIVALS
jgi:hypothetical protein